ncbi:MAG: hypothetical protein N3B01_02740 [Verrucomicrobiae bacterium]|nr:hypothetical protein [Verrucomicrobiae bacterium]
MQATLLAIIAATLPVLKTERFDRDPGWEGYSNRMEVAQQQSYSQDFGYDAKQRAVGGRITRASAFSYYAVKLVPARTLNDRLSASGAFTFSATEPGGGMFFGWFNDEQPETARPVNSLGMNFDSERTGARLAVRLINANNESCGHFVTHYIPGKFRPTPLRVGVRYQWTLDYDPSGASGKGQFVFTLSGHDKGKDPIDDRIAVELPAGFKQTGAVFTRFGIANMRKPGGSVTFWIHDLTLDGKRLDFGNDPQWEGVRNRGRFVEANPKGVQNFGYSPTSFAGGKPGEIGGVVWRGRYASYGDRVGPFTLDQPLFAGGRVALTAADPDSDAFLGWFHSGSKDQKQDERTGYVNFVGIAVGGPTRVGHYFAPQVWTAKGERARVEKGPVLRPDGKPREWTLCYDPTANGGRGAVTVTLDKEVVTLNLRDKVRAQGAHLDRFGLFASHNGGSKVKIWFDDLTYTAAPASR